MFRSLLFSPKLGCRSGRAACIDLLSNAAVWSNSIFQKVQYCPRQKHYFSIRVVFIYDKSLFHPIHGPVLHFLGGDLTLFSPPIFGNSSSKLAFIVKKRVAWTAQKMSLGRGVKFERSYTWWWCWWCLASATPTPDLRFPHIWKLHVTKFELQAAKTIWRKLERTQVSILLLRSK